MSFNWDLWGFISRLIIAIIAFLLMGFFRKKYHESKTDNLPNYYYFGNYLFFLANGFIILIVGIQDSLVYFNLWELNIDNASFYWIERDSSQLYFLSNLGENPIYLIIVIFAIIIFAVQIYPMERLLKRKVKISRLLVIDAISCGIIFIPILTLSFYQFVVMLVSFITIFLAFLMNFFLTLKIIKNSAGIVKKRAILNISGFSLYLIGLIWGMRVGWTKEILGLFDIVGNLSQDVLIGNIIIFMAILLYWRGFSAEK